MAVKKKVKKIDPEKLKPGQFCKLQGKIYQMDFDGVLQQLTGRDKGGTKQAYNLHLNDILVTPIKVKIVEVK